ncbi:hypothetical protein MHUMG1_10308 [Metarhizium humberi]|uniref:Uncharacterized protein n=1 Tax=Metarhizium humberi TaxID=2596975 RepID=A0A9P8S399_9HYPO|nr:hypothetical protein MHUMG1_10308 [Metarhizium humberi]
MAALSSPIGTDPPARIDGKQEWRHPHQVYLDDEPGGPRDRLHFNVPCGDGSRRGEDGFSPSDITDGKAVCGGQREMPACRFAYAASAALG